MVPPSGHSVIFRRASPVPSNPCRNADPPERIATAWPGNHEVPSTRDDGRPAAAMLPMVEQPLRCPISGGGHNHVGQSEKTASFGQEVFHSTAVGLDCDVREVAAQVISKRLRLRIAKRGHPQRMATEIRALHHVWVHENQSGDASLGQLDRHGSAD